MEVPNIGRALKLCAEEGIPVILLHTKYWRDPQWNKCFWLILRLWLGIPEVSNGNLVDSQLLDSQGPQMFVSSCCPCATTMECPWRWQLVTTSSSARVTQKRILGLHVASLVIAGFHSLRQANRDSEIHSKYRKRGTFHGVYTWSAGLDKNFRTFYSSRIQVLWLHFCVVYNVQ